MARIVATVPALPIPWTNQPLILYHGTIDNYVPSILAGVNVAAGHSLTDFGRGFYTTTDDDQARRWARRLSRRRPGTLPRVVRFTVGREALAALDCVWFVRGAPDAEDYWSLVHHCRTNPIADHARGAARGGWYDVAIGPLAANWSRRTLAIQDGDQISFHTATAASELDAATKTHFAA